MVQVLAAAKYFKTRLRILEITSHDSWGRIGGVTLN